MKKMKTFWKHCGFQTSRASTLRALHGNRCLTVGCWATMAVWSSSSHHGALEFGSKMWRAAFECNNVALAWCSKNLMKNQWTSWKSVPCSSDLDTFIDHLLIFLGSYFASTSCYSAMFVGRTSDLERNIHQHRSFGSNVAKPKFDNVCPLDAKVLWSLGGV